ncbi:hypothetical protein DENSPDRAFT_526859 [Dentipellis sp. KUC8613]|nr:hypothetical protein DENSPDRAFT_526859 [Dentipellis sp. KUC8613]
MLTFLSNSRTLCKDYQKTHEQETAARQALRALLANRYGRSLDQEIRGSEGGYLLQWYQLHKISLHKAAIAMLFSESHRIQTMPDLTGWSVVFYMRPCFVHGDDINPSTAFFVHEMRLQYTPIFQRMIARDTGSPSMEFDQAMRVRQETFAEANITTPLITVVPIQLVYDEYSITHTVPVFAPSHGAEVALAARMQDPNPSNYLRRWIPTLKAMVLRGHMLGPLFGKDDEDVNLCVGRMIKQGPIPTWVPLTDEEANGAGYIKFPGVVGPVVPRSSRGAS